VTTASRTTDALGRFYDWMAILKDLDGAAHLLDWDRETLMPARGAEARGRQVATLRALRHREVLREGVADDIALLEEHDQLSVEERAMLRLARREIARAERVPEELVRATSEAVSQSVTKWLTTRATGDYATFAPDLERVISLSRQMGEAIGIGEEPYDALLDQYEPHTTTRELVALFDHLRTELHAILDTVERSPAPATPSFLSRLWPADAQLAIAEDVARMVGFDLESGMIAQSAHPFTDSPHVGDVRFTTRLTADDPTGNVLVTLHEVGHALYAQGLPGLFERTLIYGSPSLGADESQSRFFENHMGRRLAFWELLMPMFRSRFGSSMDGLHPAAFHDAVTGVHPHWCRVDADEVTYDLHIVLRFDLELALIRGDLTVQDLPAAWNDAMRRLLDVTPANPAEGCMQDIHWAWGMFGYFPTYTLGNVYAAQLAEALEETVGPLDDLVRAGAFDVVLRFMRERVHSHGSTFPTRELMGRATGKPFSTDAFLDRVRRLAAG
jgi:carboxypeptidase Taq